MGIDDDDGCCCGTGSGCDPTGLANDGLFMIKLCWEEPELDILVAILILADVEGVDEEVGGSPEEESEEACIISRTNCGVCS